MQKNTKLWDNEDGKGWDVIAAEKQIADTYRVMSIAAGGKEMAQKIFGVIHRGKPEGYPEAVTEAALEMNAIVRGDHEKYRYKVTHITSGKTVFCVYSNDDCKAMAYGGQFESEQEALNASHMHSGSEVDGPDRDGMWTLWLYDEEGTEYMRQDSKCGEFVGEYDTKAEAQKESERYKYAYITEEPKEEWFAIINTETGKNAFEMLFPNIHRALAFLYREIEPEKWMALQKLRVSDKKTGGNA